MNWKKLSWKLLLFIICGIVVFIWLIKTPVMASYLTKKLGVPVSIGSISIWPSQTKILDFQIRNPRQFKLRDAFRAKTTTVNYRMKKLFGNPTDIDEIIIEDIYLSIILTSPLGKTNNWTAIAAGMPKERSSSKGKSREVIVRRLVLSNLDVEIQGGQFIKAPSSKFIKRMEFRDVSSETGFPTKELINRIFQGAGIQQYLQNLFNPPNLIKPWIPGGGLFGDEVPMGDEKE